MDVAALQAHCVGKPGAWTDFPWDHDFPVVKVGDGERGKIFAFLGADSVGVKGGATREVADEWLDRYPDAASVMRYIRRSGWNSLVYAGIPDDELIARVENVRFTPLRRHRQAADHETARGLRHRRGRRVPRVLAGPAYAGSKGVSAAPLATASAVSPPAMAADAVIQEQRGLLARLFRR